MEKILLIQHHCYSHVKCSNFIYQQLVDDFEILQVTGISRAQSAFTQFRDALKQRVTTYHQPMTLQEIEATIPHDEAYENALFDPTISQQFSAKKVLCDLTCARTIPALNMPDIEVVYYLPCATTDYLLARLSRVKSFPLNPVILYQGDAALNGEQCLQPFNQHCGFLGYLGNTNIQQRIRATPQALEGLNVLLSFGTLISDSYYCLLKLFIDLSQQWNFSLTILLGNGASEFSYDTKAENITLISSVPSLGDILYQYDVLVSHAGINSILEAILAKLPVLCIPFFADQYYMAEKVVENKIGLQISPDEIFPETIINALTTLLAHYPLYLQHIDALRQSLTTINTKQVLLDHLNS